MAEIINFADHRKKDAPTVKELVDAATSIIIGDWEKFAKSNRLSDYFRESVGVWAEEGVNYTADLNALSTMEGRLGMLVVVRAPLALHHHGWQCSFSMKSGMVHGAEMPFETYARCFAILLYVKLKRDLVVNGYTDEL